jgi:hypothetical protein
MNEGSTKRQKLTPARLAALRQAAKSADGWAYPDPRLARALRNMGLVDSVSAYGYGMHITEAGRAAVLAAAPGPVTP